MRPSISLHNDIIWISWDQAKSAQINDPSELTWEKEGGKLPDDLSPRQVRSIVKRAHRLRGNGSNTLVGVSKVLQASGLVMAVFWLGAGMLYQMQRPAGGPALSSQVSCPGVPAGGNVTGPISPEQMAALNQQAALLKERSAANTAQLQKLNEWIGEKSARRDAARAEVRDRIDSNSNSQYQFGYE